MAFTARCFHVMLQADWHTYQVLTKRPLAMFRFSEAFESYFGCIIPPHVWLGVSVENADYTHRIDTHRMVRCATRFVSFEPRIGSAGEVDLKNIDWAIIGGKSGPEYRRVRKEWITDLIRQCREQGVAVFFKQWGGPRPNSGGRMIDGRTYSEYPDVKTAGIKPGMREFDVESFMKCCAGSCASAGGEGKQLVLNKRAIY